MSASKKAMEFYMTTLAHIVVRVPLKTRIEGRVFHTIDAHNAIVDRLGYAFVAKFGAAGTEGRAKKLRDQIVSGQRTNLIAVGKRDGSFIGYQAKLYGVVIGKPTQEKLSASPPYYSDMESEGRLWFQITERFAPTSLQRFKLVTNGRPLLDVLSECRTSSMLVSE
jgi:hypothetical protein